MSRGQRCKHAGPSAKITGLQQSIKGNKGGERRKGEIGEELQAHIPQWVGWGPMWFCLEQWLV